MMIFAVGAVLIGMAIGLRFKVFIVIPITLAAVICGGALALIQHADGWAAISTMIVGVVGLQLGYLCSTLAHVFLRETRVPSHVPAPTEPKASYKSKLGLGVRTQ